MMMATDAEEIIAAQTNPSSCPVHHHHDNNSPTTTTLSIKLTRKNQDRPWKLRVIYLQCYFLTIATILGTGILGLPVTIAQAGLLPFLVSFLIGFLVQALLIYLFVELLQRCQVVQMESLKSAVTEPILMEEVGLEEPTATGHEEEEEEDGESADADTGLLPAVDVQSEAESLQPNLHLLGLLFLSQPMSHAFNCIILFQFVSIGISYVLAGSEAYAALLHVRHIYVIPAFTWILALAILFAQTVIRPITSLLTLLKGILLIVTVTVTFAVGSEVGLQSSNDFSQMGKPFLMGTVALGGIVNVMPLLFSQISHNKTQILWFRRAVLGGLTTCTVLNILWCWAVLEIVPQTSLPDRRVAAEVTLNTSSSGLALNMAYSNISLEDSEKAGEIATIPLTRIINERYSSYSWVAKLIQVFISISITVSFLVMGSALKHTIDGLVASLWSSRLEWLSKTWDRHLPSTQRLCTARSVANAVMSLFVFGVIFIVSACDPRGFVVILDKVVSFSLNTEVGLFVFVMLRASRGHRFQHISIPLPVSGRFFTLSWLLPVYFLFAVAYDVVQTAVEAADSLRVYAQQRTLLQSNHSLSAAATHSPLL